MFPVASAQYGRLPGEGEAWPGTGDGCHQYGRQYQAQKHHQRVNVPDLLGGFEALGVEREERSLENGKGVKKPPQEELKSEVMKRSTCDKKISTTACLVHSH